MLAGKRILLIISGGIAAFKAPQLIRLLRGQGAAVTPVLTEAAGKFVTPLTIGALAGEMAYTDLFDLTNEAEMGHIQLSRVADLVVVAPATANLMGKMAQGLCDDLASTLLLATDTPVLIAPAMNVRMWLHPAMQRNIAQLRDDGILFTGPEDGDMACGEHGPGRMSEPEEILAAIERFFSKGPLSGKRILVTSGPTHEPIDPVRYIANRSSGAQGTAIARALAELGAEVIFVTGPADVPPPKEVTVIPVDTAHQMLDAVEGALPVDAAVFAAAVADWRVATASGSKIKKEQGALPVLDFVENTDILAKISRMPQGRPGLVVGFAAETDDVVSHAKAKRIRKGCDWILANDVSPSTGIMGGSENAVVLITEGAVDEWPRMSKSEVASRLADRIAAKLNKAEPRPREA